MNDTEPGKTVKRSSLWMNLLAIIAVIVVLVLTTMWGLSIYTRHGQEIKVPNLKGLSCEEAVSRLEKLGLQATIDDSVYVKTMPANVIFDQSISAGDPVKEGRTIHLTINSGTAPQIILPDIADNSSLREATVKLTSIGFKLTPVEYIKGEKDWVYGVKCGGRNVSVGSRISVDQPLTLVVGDGTYYESGTEDAEGSSDSLQIDDPEDGNTLPNE